MSAREDRTDLITSNKDLEIYAEGVKFEVSDNDMFTHKPEKEASDNNLLGDNTESSQMMSQGDMLDETQTKTLVNPQKMREQQAESARAKNDRRKSSFFTRQHTNFFADVRNKQDRMKSSRFEQPSEKKLGEEVIDSLASFYNDNFVKKIPFERSNYHQCIPNPARPEELITVQLINRTTKYEANLYSDCSGASMSYGKFTLRKPKKHDDVDHGEDGGNSSEEEQELIPKGILGAKKLVSNQAQQLGQIIKKAVKVSSINPKKDRLSLIDSVEGIPEDEIPDPYKDKAVDNHNGVEPYVFATIAERDVTIQEETEAHQAIVGFWGDVKGNGTMKCYHYFTVPNPLKRQVSNVEGTILNEVLYQGKNKHDEEEIFLFYKEKKGDDKIYLGIVELNPGARNSYQCSLAHASVLKMSCKRRNLFKANSILGHFLTELDELSEVTDSKDPRQMAFKQMPNPTLHITDSNEIIVIFTAHKKPEGSKLYNADGDAEQSDDDGDHNGPVDDFEEAMYCWVPSILFFNITTKKLVFQIISAEVFIDWNREKNKITYLRNNMWQDWTQDEYHREFDSDERFTPCKWGDYFMERTYYQPMGGRRDQHSADQVLEWRVPLKDERDSSNRVMSYELLYDEHGKQFEIATNSLKMTADLHKKDKRLTVVYKDTAAYTFDIKKPRNVCRDHEFNGFYSRDEHHRQNEINARFDLRVEAIEKSKSRACRFVGKGKVDETAYDFSADIEMPDGHLIFVTEEELDHGESRMEIRVKINDDGSVKGTIDFGPSRHFRTETLKESRIYKVKLKPGVQREGYNMQLKTEEGTAIDCMINFCFTEVWKKDKKRKAKGQFRCKLKRSELQLKNMRLEPEDGGQTINLGDADYSPTDNVIKNDHIVLQMVIGAKQEFFIAGKDVQFLRTPEKSYVAGRLSLLEDNDDINSNGTGYVDTFIRLYDVDMSLKNKKTTSQLIPTRTRVVFQTRQSFINSFNKEDQLWQTMPLSMSGGMVHGSLVYEEYGTDELVINFFTARIEVDGKPQPEMCYPKQPEPQSFILDYPFLAYRNYTPMNKGIVLCHLAQRMPQRVIDLGDWEFVCWVNHTQMVEQKLFDYEHEVNCDIMMVVEKDNVMRLASIKTSPWMHYEEPESEIAENKRDNEYKLEIFLFTGKLSRQLTHGVDGQPYTEEELAAFDVDRVLLKKNRRFGADKIRNVQLITHKIGNYNSMMLIMQFDECIIANSLNEDYCRLLCESRDMVRRELVRGYNDKVFFAESIGSSEKITQVSMHPSQPNTISRNEVFQLAGSWIAAFENDYENIQNDLDENVRQAFWIMDDQQKLYYVVNEDTYKFRIAQTIDVSKHEILAEITKLRDNDWQHAFITKNSLTFSGVTYNLNTYLELNIDLKGEYFGNKALSQQEKRETLGDEEEFNERQGQGAKKWMVQSYQGLPSTCNTMAIGHLHHQEYCFVVQPAPSSRRQTIVGQQQIYMMDQFLFVANDFVLVKLKDGKCVVMNINGCIKHLDLKSSINRMLNSDRSAIQSQSNFNDKFERFVLFKEEAAMLVSDDELSVFYLLKFNMDGDASLVSKFDDIADHFKWLIEKVGLILQGNINAKSLDFVTSFQIGDPVTKQPQSSKVTPTGNQGTLGNKSMTITPGGIPVRNQKLNYKFHKTILVSQSGQIYFLAVIVSPDDYITERMEAVKQKYRIKEGASTKPNKQMYSQTVNFMAMLPIEAIDSEKADTHASEDQNDTMGQNQQLIVFQVSNDKDKTAFLQSNFLIIGDTLVHRRKMDQVCWLTKLDDVRHSPGDYPIYVQEVSSYSLYFRESLKKDDLPHLILNEVPREYHTVIKEQSQRGRIVCRKDVLQITVGSFGVMFDISDIKKPTEMRNLDMLDQFMDPEGFVPTGFVLTTSVDDLDDGFKYINRRSIYTNLRQNMTIEVNKKNWEDGTVEIDNPGILYRTYTYMDLCEVQQLLTQMKHRKATLDEIDPQTILAIFDGHTIFSICFDRVQIYELLLSQLKDIDFETEEFHDYEVENSYLRKLMQTLIYPTKDLRPRKNKNFYASTVDNAQEEQKDEFKTKRTCKDFWNRFKDFIGWSEEKVLGGHGFKSVLNKSLWLENPRYHEILMEISMMCQENTITNFVDNIDDIKMLLQSTSTTVNKFLDQGFCENRFTKLIRNVDWLQTDELRIISSTSCALSEKQVDRVLNMNTAKEEQVNTQVQVKILSLDWIFTPFSLKSQGGYGDLISVFADCPHETIFATRFTISIVEHFWSYYYDTVFRKVFIPYVVYCVIFIWYVSKKFIKPFEGSQFDLTSEFFVRQIMFVLILYFVSIEVAQLMRDRVKYITNYQNFSDWGSLVLNIFILICYVQDIKMISLETLRVLSSVAVFLMWAKLIYWLRLFSSMSFYIRLIQETLYDVRYFLLVYLIILAMFANAEHMLNMNRGEEDSIIEQHFEISYLDALYNQYLLSLGEFNMDHFGGNNSRFILGFFTLSTFFTTLTILNMVIAIMGDTFTRMLEVKEMTALSEKIQIIADYVFLVDENSDLMKNYIYMIKLRAAEEDATTVQEGVDRIKDLIAGMSKEMRHEFMEQHAELQKEIFVVDEKVNLVITELRKNQEETTKELKTQFDSLRQAQTGQQKLLKQLMDGLTSVPISMDGVEQRKRSDDPYSPAAAVTSVKVKLTTTPMKQNLFHPESPNHNV